MPPSPAGSVSPAPNASDDTSFIDEHGAGMTLTSGDNGEADLVGGRYRVGWISACESLKTEWAPSDGTAPIAVDGPTGETFVALQPGMGYLNPAVCAPGTEYTIRFEAAA